MKSDTQIAEQVNAFVTLPQASIWLSGCVSFCESSFYAFVLALVGLNKCLGVLDLFAAALRQAVSQVRARASENQSSSLCLLLFACILLEAQQLCIFAEHALL